VPKFESKFTPQFLGELDYWQQTRPETVQRIERLIEAALTDPFSGIGKPEPLRHKKLKGCWSRRITKEHRLVYLVERGVITFLQCRYHY
jgi:toxin YoeB